ncbi:protein-lysine N-methyltransferase EEF2KMT [Triplophysa dalaica]|uniref:protein-lysine N-methyltransferase EEF2KMT n=1 Tax=Triplophysa dalaica TaxID=1582913 RepID=UPI0024DF55CE|nr:protein-lysine N-methyltransferase EEF2KMT [Triplophysa dalaica]
MNETQHVTVEEEQNIIDNTRKQVTHIFQVNFFAMCLLNTFPWDLLDRELKSAKTSDVILEILDKTCLNAVCRENPPSLKYRRLFLRELIKRHERLEAEPLDALYEALGEVMCAQERDTCYKTYLLPTGDAVSLAENVAVISEGTTGLVTWDAALYMAEWALENNHIFKNKTVLELGSGVGLTGIVVCRSLSPTKYIFSDCHPTVLQRLRDNVTNCLTNHHCNSVPVCVEQQDWQNVTDEQLQRIQADTIIAADVVYDPDIISCLVKLLARVFDMFQESHPDVYIASTVRNPQTYDCFKTELEKAGLKHDIIKDAVTQVFPYNRVSTIEMIKIRA